MALNRQTLTQLLKGLCGHLDRLKTLKSMANQPNEKPGWSTTPPMTHLCCQNLKYLEQTLTLTNN